MTSRAGRLLLLLLIAICIAGFIYKTRSAATRDATGTVPTDFPNYYYAGERLFSGQPIYLGFEAYVTKKLARKYSAYPADPPATVALLAPTALLPYRVSWWIFYLASTLFIAGASALVARDYGIEWFFTTVLTLLSLVTVPALFLLQKNHMESILVALGATGFVLFRRGKPYWGAALWGLAGALKVFPLLWLLALSRTRPMREIAFGFLSFFIFSLLGVLAVGWPNTLTFMRDVSPRYEQWLGRAGNLSLFSFGTAIEGEGIGLIFVGVGAALCVLSLARAKDSPLCVRWLLGVGWSIVLSPLGWINYFTLLTAPLIACGASLQNAKARSAFILAAIVLFFWPEAVAVPSSLVTVLLSFVPMYLLLGFLLSGAARS